MRSARRRSPRLALSAVAAALPIACVVHPTRVETGTYSRDEALRRCDAALRMRYGAVLRGDPRFPVLRTGERYAGNQGLARTRAFVSLVPGEDGWAAEITVLREELDSSPDVLTAAPRWRYAGRDAEIESFLVRQIREEGKNAPIFTDLPASAPSSEPRGRA